MKSDKKRPTTHANVHAGFSGLPRSVARKKGPCKLIGNHFVIPHDTILLNVVPNCGTQDFSLNLDKLKTLI